MAEKINLEQLAKFVKSTTAKTRKQIIKAAREAAQQGKAYIVSTAIPNAEPHAPVDRGLYRNSWKVTEISSGKTDGVSGIRLYSDSPYASIIEYGRRPGEWPNIGAIREWVYRHFRERYTRGGKLTGAKNWTRKGFDKNSEMKSLAFLIARSIKEKGVKPRHILTGSMPVIERMFDAALRRVLKQDKE